MHRSDIPFLRSGLCAAEHERLCVREIAVSAAEEAEELVEAALLRMKLRRAAQVPLADQAGRVAGRLEPIGDRGFRERQADLPLDRRFICFFVAGVPLALRCRRSPPGLNS